MASQIGLACSCMSRRKLDFVVLVLVLSEAVLVLEGTCWDVVGIRAKYRGSNFLKN